MLWLFENQYVSRVDVWGLHSNSLPSSFSTGHREEIFHKRSKSGESGLHEETIVSDGCFDWRVYFRLSEELSHLTRPVLFLFSSADDWFHRQKTVQLQKLALWLMAAGEGGWPYCTWAFTPSGNHHTRSSTFSTSHKPPVDPFFFPPESFFFMRTSKSHRFWERIVKKSVSRSFSVHQSLISTDFQSANIHIWPSEAKRSILESFYHAVNPGDKERDLHENMRKRVIITLVLDRERN